MNRIFLVLLAALTFFFGAEVANSVLAELDGDCEKVAYYFQDNIYILNYMDKEMGYEGDIKGIGRIEKVTVKSDQEDYRAFFCEFTNDDGYLLLADDYLLLDYVRHEESPFKKIYSNEYYFNQLTSGYFYLDVNGDYLSSDPNKNTTEDTPAGWGDFLGLADLTSYVKDEYGGGYVRRIGYSLGYTPTYSTSDLTVYFKNGQPKENNCGLTAIFYALQAIKYRNLLPNFPANNAVGFTNIWNNESAAYQIEVDLLGKYCRYNQGYAYNFPVLYSAIRKYCSREFWKIENLITDEVHEIIEHLIDKYDSYELNTQYTTQWEAFVPDVTKQLLSYGMPSIFKARIDGNYHFMPVLGYTLYEKTTTFLWWTTTKTVTFFKVTNKDGNLAYYDVSDYGGTGSLNMFWLS